MFKRTTLAVQSFGRFGRNNAELLEKMATSVVFREEGGENTRKGVLMECIEQVISTTVQVAISRRVRRNRLALRGRQEGGTAADHGEGALSILEDGGGAQWPS